eukprot:7745321-Pyramimonas_sp.AAC.1
MDVRAMASIALPKNALRTFCGFHGMFLEQFWRSLSCFGTSGLCSKNVVFVLRTSCGFSEHVVGALGFLGSAVAVDSATLPHQDSTDVLGSQGCVSCGRLLVDWPPMS